MLHESSIDALTDAGRVPILGKNETRSTLKHPESMSSNINPELILIVWDEDETLINAETGAIIAQTVGAVMDVRATHRVIPLTDSSFGVDEPNWDDAIAIVSRMNTA
jgi:hypothetical protein